MRSININIYTYLGWQKVFVIAQENKYLAKLCLSTGGLAFKLSFFLYMQFLASIILFNNLIILLNIFAKMCRLCISTLIKAFIATVCT